MENSSIKITNLLKRLESIKSHIHTKIRSSGFNGAVLVANVNHLISNLNLLKVHKIQETAVDNLLYQLDRIDEGGLTSKEVGYEVEKLVNEISSYLDTLIHTLKSVLPHQDVNSVNIKLPSIQNFSDLSKFSRDLHIAISQLVINDEIGGQEKIESVENGSIWINVFVGTPAAMSIIGATVWAAAVIRKKKLEGDFAIEQVKSMKVKNDILNGLKDAHLEAIKRQIEAEAKLIQSEHFKSDDPENVQRIQNSIKVFSELIFQGVEIQPTVSAPENISNLFPKALDTIESRIPMIDKL